MLKAIWFAHLCPSFRRCVSQFFCLSVYQYVWDYMFPQYLQYPSMDFHRTFVIGASWNKDELIRFGVKRSKVKGHITTAEASWKHLTLPSEWRFLVFSLYGYAWPVTVSYYPQPGTVSLGDHTPGIPRQPGKVREFGIGHGKARESRKSRKNWGLLVVRYRSCDSHKINNLSTVT